METTSVDNNIPNLEENVKNSFPSELGLYPHEILVLNYASKFYIDQTSYQSFWLYEYGIRDMGKILKSLFERGFLVIGDLKHAIENETISILKEELRKHNLKLTGKKSELIERLLSEVPREILNLRFTRKRYQLTDIGIQSIEDEDYIMYIHKKHPSNIGGLTIWKLNQLMNSEPYMPYRDKIWGYLNERSIKNPYTKDAYLYRDTRICMARFLHEEKQYEKELPFLAEVIYLTLNGVCRGFSPYWVYVSIKRNFPYGIPYLVLESVINCKELLNLSEDELKMYLIDGFGRLEFSIEFFTREECADIVIFEINKDRRSILKICATAEQRFKESYPEIFYNPTNPLKKYMNGAKRRERNPETGKNDLLMPRDRDYFDWLKENLTEKSKETIINLETKNNQTQNESQLLTEKSENSNITEKEEEVGTQQVFCDETETTTTELHEESTETPKNYKEILFLFLIGLSVITFLYIILNIIPLP